MPNAEKDAGRRSGDYQNHTTLPRSGTTIEYRLKSGRVGGGMVDEPPWKQSPHSDATWVTVGDETVNWNEVSFWRVFSPVEKGQADA